MSMRRGDFLQVRLFGTGGLIAINSDGAAFARSSARKFSYTPS